MDAKTIAIGVLVAMAVLLGGLVASGLHQEQSVYAQGGVYATYLATSVQVREDFANFAILDTDTRRLLFYDMQPPAYQLRPSAGREMAKDMPPRK